MNMHSSTAGKEVSEGRGPNLLGPVSLAQILDREVCAAVLASEKEAPPKFIPDPAYTVSCSLQLVSKPIRQVVQSEGVSCSDSVSGKCDPSEVKSTPSGGGVVTRKRSDISPESECVPSSTCVVGEVGGQASCSSSELGKRHAEGGKGLGSNQSGDKQLSLFTSSSSSMPGHKFLPPLGKIMGNGNSSAQKADKMQNKMSNSPSNISRGSSKGGPTPEVVYPVDYLQDKDKLREQEERLRELQLSINMHKSENSSLRREVKARNEQITKYKREMDKIKSVLTSQALSFQDPETLLARLQELHLTVGQQASAKRQGVSGESGADDSSHTITHFNKAFSTKNLLKSAFTDNDLLNNILSEPSQIQAMIETMYPQTFLPGTNIIKQGDAGSHMYVADRGEIEVWKDEKLIGKLNSGKAFGELAIMYGCRRTATIKAVSEVMVWVLDRRVYQLIMKRHGVKKRDENIAFLQSVPLFANLNEDHLSRISDALQTEHFAEDNYIIRQGANGDSFYILKSGNVKVTKKVQGQSVEEDVRALGSGSYFGEQALLREECRTASVIACHGGVECLVLDRDSFNQLIGDLSELREKKYGDDHDRQQRNILSTRNPSPEEEFSSIRLDDLHIIATLGVGGFGRVELVQQAKDTSRTFALKCLRKSHIVETQQQDHVFSEKRIMMTVRSPFVCRLYKTFRDTKCVYMLMEACLGGEVWTILRDRGWFGEETAKFICACVIEALQYLHSKNIIYRDLKPENLLLDNTGYVKLVDFGFSKYIGPSNKTWTFCGTPEYVAPEVIQNRGHDRAVDYWSVGVLLFELLTGTPPFNASDPMKTYSIILRGIDMINFPQQVTRSATHLIKRLCRENVTERLGYQKGGIQDIKKHRWFQGFDWEGLTTQQLAPPILPRVASPTDASNFDQYPRDPEIPVDEDSGWDLEF